MVSAASMSRSTSPAPTEGSWSTSPTSSRCAPGGTALISLLARIRSSMLASSTTIRSASSGWSRSKLGSPPGRSCSSRCTVVAGCPDSSVSRFAARPVGAASTIFARFAAANVITDLTVNDLPQPGPPVSTATRCVSASRTACSCSGGQLRPGPGPQPRQRLAPVDRRRRRASGPPAWSSSRSRAAASDGLGAVERHQIHRRDRPAADARVGHRFADHPLGGGQLGQAGADQVGGHAEDLRGVGEQVRLGQVAVPVVGGLGQRVLDAGLHPLRAVVRDPDRLGDRVGGLEPDPPHLGGQPVRLVAHHRDRRVAVLLVDPHRQRGGHPDALQEDHHLLDGLLLLPRPPDHRRAFRAQPGHLDQPPRLLLDHPQRVHAEVPDDPAGGPRPDPLDQPRAEVAFDALDRGRQHRGVRVDLELPPVPAGASPTGPTSRRLSPGCTPSSAPTTVSRSVPERSVATRAIV